MSSQKILVSNRGEIACRIFQAAKEMGMITVGIFVKGDESARHVTFADELIEVPSYLDANAIAIAAKNAGVSFVHPGYGFLSERSHFVDAVEKSGMVFLGPKSETMEALGGKIAAKELAESLNIPTIPWAKVKAGENLENKAASVGFPLLLKAQAGGGGKGMRLVSDAKELKECAESAANEAQSAFGDATLFLERYLIRPRHIEVQVFGDGRGNGVHCYERECSMQRRHQKIWEEATAPNLKQETRDALFSHALNLVKATRYRSAGTIEFLVDAEENIYFIEMNTRLQVEHTVSELVSGVDLVHEQIRLGMYGEKYQLFTPGEKRGHAIEVRICAENPAADFSPCTGRIEKIIWPMGPGIRVDRGIEEGQEVTVSFDSMLAKLIVWAPTRELAVQRMKFALNETVIAGVGTNLGLLEKLTQHNDVIAGKIDTDWINRNSSILNVAMTNDEVDLFLSASPLLTNGTQMQKISTEQRPSPWVKR